MVKDFTKELLLEIQHYTDEVRESVEVAKEEETNEAVKLLRGAPSPKLTGDYQRGWGRKKVGKSIIVHNRTNYQLTHLLEYGHQNTDGTRTAPVPHIRPVEEKVIQSFVEKVERAIKG
ncbi:HK97 gp10 family phage protein [Mangrovibacillus cuniculi]|uniref:HK97 gp10 family phage protein n=1 Tax=Mangrovibacillus cuniculi TaxID=2593652 RepID=A0A7S8CC41_9BACI|nr:HK97 gp10 family phage protein [Mangrovibacillus cuniculi]QPC47111.1 HK97 gp10 family phage protein [Mangrovibacillus cuniculi]